jgi:hypothetical protein
MKEKNEPTRQFEEIWRQHNDPEKINERIIIKRREEIKQERETDYCLDEQNEERINF